MSNSERSRRRYDSSITRVWPFFRPLLRRDPGGLSWLPVLLRLAAENGAGAVASDPGSLLPEVTVQREIGPRVLKYYGVAGLLMERCFERTIPPAAGFLRWLIEHPGQMTWPRRGKLTYSDTPQLKRERLFGLHGPYAAQEAQLEALAELERLGATKAHGKWWAFEGTTQVDCYLETRDLVLLVEGKRTETLSVKTNWYPYRNQLVRNLEVAREIAGGKQFAVLVMAEEPVRPPSHLEVKRSLPHFTPAECERLMGHYLGCIRWKDACRAVGIQFEGLPDTVEEYVRVCR